MEFLRPDVYVERVPSGERPISSVGTSTGAFVGVAPRGIIGKPLLCTNWSEFIENTAYGLDTPFMVNSDLAYAVYGFFQNGGSRCYVVRTAHETAKKASVKIPEENGVTFYALDEGTWANNALAVQVVANEDNLFDVIVKFNNTVVEQFTGCSNDPQSPDYYDFKINNISKFITVEVLKELVAGEGIMTGGEDGIEDITDEDYIGDIGLKALDGVEVNLVAIPGQTSAAVLRGLLEYCEKRGDCFAILDAPLGNSVQEVVAFRASLSASDYGALYYPWIKVVDPLSNVGRLRLTPPSGHIMGLYARTDKKRGVYKAPAGEEATLSGVVELETIVGEGALELLNPQSINAIIARPNIGIIVWGARTLSNNTNRRYVSDVRLDINIEVSCRKGTSWVVFEPNDEDLWKRFRSSLESYLDTLWRGKVLKGATKEQAYYVKCDAELNTASTIDAGLVIAEIGYAKKRPAEFVVIRIVQKASQ